MGNSKKNQNHLGILASTVNVEITTSWDHQKWHQYDAGRGKDMRVNLMGLTEKGPQSWGTAAAISQEAQGRGQGKTLPCAYRELVVQLVGEQRVRELPEVHLAEGAHAVNVADGQLRNVLRLKFTAGQEDTKWLRKRKASKSHPPAVQLCQSQHSYRRRWTLDATPDRRYIPCTTPCCSRNSAQLWRTWGTKEHVPALSGAPESSPASACAPVTSHPLSPARLG